MQPAQIEVKGLKKHFPILRGILFKKPKAWVKAVDGVDFSVRRGETLSIVGESGSGKTTIAKLILLLEEPTAGTILHEGKDINTLAGGDLQNYRRAIQPVFQDPASSLSPRSRVSSIISEPLEVGGSSSREEIAERVSESLRLVGLPPNAGDLFPNEFSGGQKQRIAIARALCSNPELILLDEPVASLDVSIRAQIINLLATLQEQLNHSYILISHDLAVAAYMSTSIAVMYLGKIVELGPSDTVCTHAAHPYSQALFLAALPHHPDQTGGDVTLSGEIPSPLAPPPGCAFHPRCACPKPICSEQEPV